MVRAEGLRGPVSLGKVLFAFIVVSGMFASGLPAAPVIADSEEGGESESGNPPASSPTASEPAIPVGSYLKGGAAFALEPWHVFDTAAGIRIEAPPGGHHLKLNPAFLESRLGDWGAEGRYQIGSDGSIEFSQRKVSIERLLVGVDPVFTQGGNSSIRFAERPMWVTARQEGEDVVLDLDDGDTSGQPVFVSMDFLHGHGIHRPVAHHEDGTPLVVTRAEDGTGYWIEIPHFSEVVLSRSQLMVYGRTGSITTTHIGDVTWNNVTEELKVFVPPKLTTYKVLVEQDWFALNLTHYGLVNHPFTVEPYQGNPYLMVTLTAAQTPTTLTFRNVTAMDINLFTPEGSPSVVFAHPFNTTLREERGPMWYKAVQDTTGIEVDLSAAGGGLYEVLLSKEWLDGRLVERPVFEGPSGPLVLPVVQGQGWLLSFTDNIQIRIWDSAVGPMLPPTHKVNNGTTTRDEGGCGILHVALVQNGSAQYEGPGCLTPQTQLDLAAQVAQATNLHGAAPYTACALLFLNATGTPETFTSPCSAGSPTIGTIPPALATFCSTANWGATSDEAFCGGVISRYEAAGVPLDTNATAAAALDSAFQLQNGFLDQLNALAGDESLQAERAWLSSVEEFRTALRLDGWCINETASIKIGYAMPETVCGRTLLEFPYNNGTFVANETALTPAWRSLYADSPCAPGTDTFVFLHNGSRGVCGERIPFLRSAMENMSLAQNWTNDCPGHPIGFIDPGGHHKWLCAHALQFQPASQEEAAWNNMTTAPACAGSVPFILDPAGPIPTTLCQGDATALTADLAKVFASTLGADLCGDNATILAGSPGLGGPAIVCAAKVPVPPEIPWNVDICGGETVPWFTPFQGASPLGEWCNLGRPEWSITNSESPDDFWELLEWAKEQIPEDPIEQEPRPPPGPGPDPPCLDGAFLFPLDEGPAYVCPNDFSTPVPGPLPNPCGDPAMPVMLDPLVELPDEVCDVVIPEVPVMDIINEIMNTLEDLSYPCEAEILAWLPPQPMTVLVSDCAETDKWVTIDGDVEALVGELLDWGITYPQTCPGGAQMLFQARGDPIVICGIPVTSILEEILDPPECDLNELLQNQCGYLDPVECEPVPGLPDPCIEYVVVENGVRANVSVPIGTPWVTTTPATQDPMALWLVGAPVLGIHYDPPHTELTVGGFTGVLAAIVSPAAEEGEFEFSAAYGPVSLGISSELVASAAATQLENRWTLGGEVLLPNVLWSLAEYVEPELPENPVPDVQTNLVLTATEPEVPVKVTVDIGTLHLELERGAATSEDPGTFLNQGWAASVTYTDTPVEQNNQQVGRDKTIDIQWAAPTRPWLTFVYGTGPVPPVSIAIGRMPHQAHGTVLLTQRNGWSSYQVIWSGTTAVTTLGLAFGQTPISIGNPPQAFAADVLVRIVETGWSRVAVNVAANAGPDGSTLDPTGQLIPDGYVPGAMDVHAELSGVAASATGVAHNLELVAAWEKEPSDGTAILPHVGVDLDNPAPAFQGESVINELVIDGMIVGQFRVNARMIRSIHANLTEAANNLDLRFGDRGSVDVELSAPPVPYVITASADCVRLSGTLFLSKAVNLWDNGQTPGASGYKSGSVETSQGYGSLQLSPLCTSGDPFSFYILRGGDLVPIVVLQQAEPPVAVTFDFNSKSHVHDHVVSDFSTEHYVGQKTSLNATASLGGADFALDANDWGLDLKAKVADAESLQVHYAKDKGRTYKGAQMGDNDGLTDIGWRVEESGEIDFRYAGSKGLAGFDIPFWIEVKATPVPPQNVDHVSFDVNFWADRVCNESDFDLPRTGGSETRCEGGLLTMRVLEAT